MRAGAIAANRRRNGVGVGSYLFDGVDDYMELTVTVGATPLTLMAWVRPLNVDTTPGKTLLQANVQGGGNWARILHSNGVLAQVSSATGSGGTAVGTGVSLNTWTNVIGVFTSSTSRAIYKDAGTGGTNSTNIATAGTNRITIGASRSPTTDVLSQFASGQIAHVAVWNMALSATDRTALAGGALPTMIQSGNLIFYAPLNDGTAIDTISGNPLTVSGAVSHGAKPF